jgi:Lysylphosphatidylglycerol synthase TM region
LNSRAAIAIPSTPGYIGPFEASLQVLLKLYDIPSATILSYAIALRVVMFVTVPMIAMVLGWRLGLLGAGSYKKAVIAEVKDCMLAPEETYRRH